MRENSLTPITATASAMTKNGQPPWMMTTRASRASTAPTMTRVPSIGYPRRLASTAPPRHPGLAPPGCSSAAEPAGPRGVHGESLV